MIIEKTSRPFDIFFAKTWVVTNKTLTKIMNNSKENMLRLEVIMKNQKEKPAVIANDLKRGEDVFILYRIYECHKSWLG